MTIAESAITFWASPVAWENRQKNRQTKIQTGLVNPYLFYDALENVDIMFSEPHYS